jgi:hypothetical protein
MAEVTVTDAANVIEQAAERHGAPAGVRALNTYLDRQNTRVSLGFKALLVTELRQRDEQRARRKQPTINLWRV